jgi:hypothetical protein
MTTEGFRRIALSFEGAEESSHMNSPDFRVGRRIFATLASQDQGYGNLMLTPEQQAAFMAELPQVFLPVAGGWGRMGAAHIRLASATEDVLTGALRTAWQLRIDKNDGRAAKKTLSGGTARGRQNSGHAAQPNNPAAKRGADQSHPKTGHPCESQARRRRHSHNRCRSNISIRCDRHSYADSN